MDIGSILLILSLFIFVALFVSRPLLSTETAGKVSVRAVDDDDLSHLLAERDRILNAIKELDFDYALHKIPEAEYPTQRAALIHQGAEILKQLDEMGITQPEAINNSAVSAPTHTKETDSNARTNLDEARNGRKRVEAVGKVVDPNDELEVMIANRRRNREEKAAGFCTHCGCPLKVSDHFCPRCGNPVT